MTRYLSKLPNLPTSSVFIAPFGDNPIEISLTALVKKN